MIATHEFWKQVFDSQSQSQRWGQAVWNTLSFNDVPGLDKIQATAVDPYEIDDWDTIIAWFEAHVLIDDNDVIGVR